MEKRCLGCMKLKEQSPVCEHCGYNENIPNYPHQLPIGTVLRGQYIVGKVLGQGGFGITYIGWDTSLEAAVAIKEYYPNSFVSRECSISLDVSCAGKEAEALFRQNRERFLREARVLAKLSSVPGIVRVHNLFTENNTAYIVMEYVEGIDLKRYIRMRNRVLTVEETFAVLRPVMYALSKVHESDLVHRDISPDNIMILPDGSAKLLDFGAVREVAEADVYKDLPQSTEAILKHGFAPIEQYRRRGNLGPWTDVYALCATMYYCLTGSVPADAPERVMGDDNVNWNSIPGLTSGQAALLDRGMALMPEKRVGTMEELGRGLFTQPRQAPAPTPEKEKQKPRVMETRKKKKKKAFGLIAAVLAVVAALGGFALRSRGANITVEVPQILPAATETTEAMVLSEEEIRYREAKAWEADGQLGKAAIAFGKLGDYEDARERSFALWDNVVPRKTLFGSTLAIKKDNTVILRGYPKYKDAVSRWTDIIDLEEGYGIFGLKADGTVLAVGENIAGECDVSGWTDIVDIVAGNCVYSIQTSPRSWYSYNQGYTLGLKSDGTVLATGDNNWGQCDVSDWTDIVAISVGSYTENNALTYAIKPRTIGDVTFDTAQSSDNYYTVGLKVDGTVVTAGKIPEAWDLSEWTDIVKISTSGEHIAGLKSDGTVVSTYYDQSKLSGWNHITDIDAGPYHLLGLRSDGTVTAIGNVHIYNHLAVEDWTDIVAISASDRTTVGLKADGTVVAVGTIGHDGGPILFDISEMSDIVAIEVEKYAIIGLQDNGTAIIGSGTRIIEQSELTDIKMPANIPTNSLPARNSNEAIAEAPDAADSGELTVLDYRTSDGFQILDPSCSIRGNMTNLRFSWTGQQLTCMIATWKSGRDFTDAEIQNAISLYLPMWKAELSSLGSLGYSANASFPEVPESDCYVLLLAIDKDWNCTGYTVLHLGYGS